MPSLRSRAPAGCSGSTCSTVCGSRRTELPPGTRPRTTRGADCTIRDGDRFGKIGVGPELLTAQRELWAHRHELGFAVAEPLGYEARHRCGWPRCPACGPTLTPELAERMGAALATLAPLERPAGDRPGDARPRDGADPPRSRAARRACEELLADPPPPGPPRPIHGAPHPPQWLLDGDTLGLIDFDRLALGDPEADVAAFMEAAAAEDDGEPVAEAFARGYGALDPRRLDYYRRERRVAKALRAASALRPDGDERAARRLE